MISSETKAKLYIWALSLLAVDVAVYIAALLRTPHIDPTGIEFTVYFLGGGPLALVSLLVISLSRGKLRLFLVLVDLVLLYLWFSYFTFQVMLH